MNLRQLRSKSQALSWSLKDAQPPRPVMAHNVTPKVEGEVVDFFNQVNVVAGDKKGAVEKWLLEVQDSMIHCLTKAGGSHLASQALKPATCSGRNSAQLLGLLRDR